MTENFPSITRRSALLSGAAAAATMALPTSFGFAANISSTPTPVEGDNRMGYITTKDGVEIFYKDWGAKDAQPIVFHHG